MNKYFQVSNMTMDEIFEKFSPQINYELTQQQVGII